MDQPEQPRPKPPAPPLSEVPEPGDVRIDGAAGSLLIVDDDDAVRSFVCLACRRLGYHVFEATNGVEALKIFEDNPGRISVVLTDINMPRMDGRALITALRKFPSVPGIAVMSGRMNPEMRTTLRADGVTALLDKPFSTATLKLILQQAVTARA